jgi:hypothetical protein
MTCESERRGHHLPCTTLYIKQSLLFEFLKKVNNQKIHTQIQGKNQEDGHF